MKILILYYSKGGNTKKMAEAIGRGVLSVEGAEPILRSATDVTKNDFLEASGVIAGSPVYFGVMAAGLKKVFDDFVGTRKKMEGKIGAAFATSGDPTGGKETTMMSIICCMLIYGMIIVGDPMSATGHYGTACVGAPDTDAVANAEKLGERVATVAKKMFA
ncbi:MAG: flavodoxin family protein [Deltaproteobacteria bacterium]|nr:flavodoxin family protein [Deltaproteobacteria bacterium]